MRNTVHSLRWKRFFVFQCFVLCLFLQSFTAKAAPSFSYSLTNIASNERSNILQITITNDGADFNGSVRLLLKERYTAGEAYDVVISLPSQTTKQFNIEVPTKALDGNLNDSLIQILNQNNEMVVEYNIAAELSKLLPSLQIGVLSDHYSALTYLDLGGDFIYYQGNDLPIKTEELNVSNLLENLPLCQVLVINDFDTGILTSEQVDAIEEWTENGGCLLIGTGSNVAKTTKAFSKSFIDLDYSNPIPPTNDDNYDFRDYNFNISKLTTIDITYYGGFNGPYFGGYSCHKKAGAVTVLVYDLAELGALSPADFDVYSDPNSYYMNILDQTIDCNARYQGNQNNDKYDIWLFRLLDAISNENQNMKFALLKFLLVMYVIIVGLALYVVLRKMKKQELYWIATPISAFLMIFIVFFAGRGFNASGISAFSMTISDLSDANKNAVVLAKCYSSSHDEWNKKIADDFQYIGSIERPYNDTYGNDYSNHVIRNGNNYYIGHKPSRIFQNCYFIGERANQESGSISIDNIENFVTQNGSCNISNQSGRNFSYYAIVANDCCYIYKDLPNGQSKDLQITNPIFTISSIQSSVLSSDFSTLFTDTVSTSANIKKIGESNLKYMGALGVALTDTLNVDNVDGVVVLGLVDGYNRAIIDDSCQEESYGCVYMQLY